MKKKYDYTIYPDNSVAKFKEACSVIERAFPKLKKGDLLVDVDGSTIQVLGAEPNEIIIYDDYDVGAVYIKSDIDLSGYVKDYWNEKRSSGENFDTGTNVQSVAIA